MIVRDRPNGLRLFLVLRGSILPNIWKSLLVTTLLAVLVTLFDGRAGGLRYTLSPIPFTLMGLPLAIFLGFRNNAAYDRYWEGRKQWGELVARSRSLARQCLTLIGDDAPGASADNTDAATRARMVGRAIAYAHALRHHLRRSDPDADLAPWLDAAERVRASTMPNVPQALMLEMGRDLGACLRARRIEPNMANSIDETLSVMTGIATACERLRGTPIPFSYTLLLHRTAYLYCFLLPFGLVGAVGYLTPVVTAIVAYTFFGLDALGDEIEEPFGTNDHDLPLDAMCRTIEIDLRAAMGERDLPAPLQPVDFRLT